MEPSTVAVLVTVALASGSILFFGRRAKKARVHRFRSRGDTTSEWSEFAAREALTGAEVSRCLKIIEDITGIPAPSLRPTDRFDRELAPQTGWEFGDETLDLGWLLESNVRGSAMGVDTVGEFVKQFVNNQSRTPERDASRTALL